MLFGAAMHAGWNAVLKIKLEPFLAMTLITAASGIMAVPALIYTGLPNAASWGWAGCSLFLHCCYYFALTAAYARADMSQVYPVARGSAPLLTATGATTVFGETISSVGIAGIAVLGLGIFIMTLRPRRGSGEPMDRGALFFALLTAVIICGYTLSDGMGARASGDPLAFSALLFVLNGIALVAIALLWRGRDALSPMRDFLWPGFAGGIMSGVSYTIVIWAMTIAPIALVAAVRETSVLFGAAIAVIFLKEPLRLARILAAGFIVFGLVLIRLQ